MYLKKIFSVFFCCIVQIVAYSQSKPYFQQEVDTKINVMLDDVQNFLRGDIEIVYTNNAPDTLFYLYFHLYPNAYSSDRTAFEKQAVENKNTGHYLAKKNDWGYIDSLKFKVDDMPAQLVTTTDADIIKLLLPQPILPGQKISISTPFRVKIPKTFSRMGHEGQSYQISQWFPKPAVYDNKGWHPMPYLDQGEFYSEYGKYDVSISLPSNYVVMATGNLETVEEQQWIDDLARQEITDSTKKKTEIPSAASYKTIRYTEDNVHDFAWFAAKNWIVKKDTIAVPESENIVTIYTAFIPEHQKGWAHAIQDIKDAIVTYSKMVGPYPYKTVKVVEGSLSAGGGMEYPTVCVIAPSNSSYMNRTTIIHEVGHNWFYGMLGTNERQYPWMDEGINSFYEDYTSRHKSVNTKSTEDKFYKRAAALDNVSFTQPMAIRTDQAMGLSSEVYTANAYGADVYSKSKAYLKWLRAYIGAADFDLAMKQYFEQWKFKHPQPEDFEHIFKAATDKDISWFFEGALKSNQPIDFGIGKVRSVENKKEVTLKNTTGFSAPVAVVADSGNIFWTEPFQGHTKLLIPQDFKTLSIAADIPDFNLKNNSTKKSFSVKPILSLTPSTERRLFIAPAIGYNVYDRFMLGALLHNVSVPERPFQYMLAPLFAFGSKTLVGSGVLSYATYPHSDWIQEIDINVEGKRFSYKRSDLNVPKMLRSQYYKVSPEIRFLFKKQNPRSPVNKYFSLKAYYIGEQQFDFLQNPIDSNYTARRGKYETSMYLKAQYAYANARTFNPYALLIEGQAGQDFAKLSVEGNLKIDYFYKKKAFYLRAFAGKMFLFDSENAHTNRYRFAATYSGWNDYFYDQTYIGRDMQSTLASQQIYIKDGGMKIPTLLYSNQIGLTNSWMAAINLKADLPLGLPIQLFADFMTFDKAKEVNPNQSKILYDAGFSLVLGTVGVINFPVLMSSEYMDYKKSILGKNAFLKSITFNINLDKLYWPRLQRQLSIF